MKFIIRSALALAALGLSISAPASATVFHFVLSGPAYDADWYLDSDPATAYAGNAAPDEVLYAGTPGSGVFTITDAQGNAGSFPGYTFDYVSDVIFYSAALNGGVVLEDAYGSGSFVSLFGDQVYSGTEAAPMFSIGQFALSDGLDSFTLDVSDCGCTPNAPVPEPSTWLMMIAGFSLLGGSMRYTIANRREVLA